MLFEYSPFVLLLLAFITLWSLPVRRAWPWLTVAAVIAGYMQGLLAVSALVVIAAFGGLCFSLKTLQSKSAASAWLQSGVWLLLVFFSLAVVLKPAFLRYESLRVQFPAARLKRLLLVQRYHGACRAGGHL